MSGPPKAQLDGCCTGIWIVRSIRPSGA